MDAQSDLAVGKPSKRGTGLRKPTKFEGLVEWRNRKLEILQQSGNAAPLLFTKTTCFQLKQPSMNQTTVDKPDYPR